MKRWMMGNVGLFFRCEYKDVVSWVKCLSDRLHKSQYWKMYLRRIAKGEIL